MFIELTMSHLKVVVNLDDIIRFRKDSLGGASITCKDGRVFISDEPYSHIVGLLRSKNEIISMSFSDNGGVLCSER